MKATLRLKAEDAEDVQELLPPSYLPCLDAKPGANGSWQSAEIPFKDGVRLKSFCIQQKVSSCSILQLAWALKSKSKAAKRILHGGKLTRFPLMMGDPRKVYRPILGCSSEKTVVKICHLSISEGGHRLIYHQAQVIDKANLSRTYLLATIHYREWVLSVVSAMNVANVYAKAIQEIMKHSTIATKDIDLLSARDLEQLRMRNQDFPQQVDSCVHELVLRHADRSPQ
ncbi:MAG: hypothetical protein Q9221_005679 [Calogaya cf. arnoldii]